MQKEEGLGCRPYLTIYTLLAGRFFIAPVFLQPSFGYFRDIIPQVH
jgi:hypothetical protein